MAMTAIYTRISQDREGAGLGVERQAEDCRRLAEQLGLGNVELLTDNDLSAYSGKRRPAYEQLLAGVESGRYDHVLTWHADRLHRSPLELERFIDIIESNGVTVHSVKGGRVDLSSPEGRMQARILGSLARYESEHKSDRIRRKMDELAAGGHHRGGRRAYGYESDGLTPRPAEVAVINEALRRILAGEALHSLCKEFMARGIPAAEGPNWHAVTLKQVITRPRNAGLRVHRGEIVGPSLAPAIVDKDLWETACALLNSPERKAAFYHGREHRYLLPGIALCGVCGSIMKSGFLGLRGNKKAVLKCRSADHLSRDMAFVDNVVESVLVGTPAVPGWLAAEEVTAGQTADATQADETADALRQRLNQLEDAFADGALSLEGLKRGTTRIRERLATIGQEAALARLPSPTAGVTPENWHALPLARKRAVISYFMEIRILPVGRVGRHKAKDPSTIEIARREPPAQ